MTHHFKSMRDKVFGVTKNEYILREEMDGADIEKYKILVTNPNLSENMIDALLVGVGKLAEETFNETIGSEDSTKRDGVLQVFVSMAANECLARSLGATRALMEFGMPMVKDAIKGNDAVTSSAEVLGYLSQSKDLETSTWAKTAEFILDKEKGNETSIKKRREWESDPSITLFPKT